MARGAGMRILMKTKVARGKVMETPKKFASIGELSPNPLYIKFSIMLKFSPNRRIKNHHIFEYPIKIFDFTSSGFGEAGGNLHYIRLKA